uniref:Uncharacterized protein n=1 Tax=Pararge aegeria TaxID=116150 RepID=S4P570_9NEOP
MRSSAFISRPLRVCLEFAIRILLRPPLPWIRFMTFTHHVDSTPTRMESKHGKVSIILCEYCKLFKFLSSSSILCQPTEYHCWTMDIGIPNTLNRWRYIFFGRID